MKKTTAIIIFLIIVVYSSFAGKSDLKISEEQSELLISKSVELTQIMGELARSEAYVNALTSSPEMVEIIEGFADADYTSPIRAVTVVITSEIIDKFFKSNSSLPLDLEGDALNHVRRKLGGSLVSLINSQQGINAIASTSLLIAGTAFAYEGDFPEYAFVLLCYDGYDSMTYLYRIDENVAGVSTSFVFLSDDVKEAVTDGTVEEYFSTLSEYFDLDGVEINYIEMM